MGQGNCKETIRHRIKRVLADGLPGCRGCLFETTKTDGWKASGSRLALVPAAVRVRGLRPSGWAVSYELLSLSERSTGKRLWGTLLLG